MLTPVEQIQLQFFLKGFNPSLAVLPELPDYYYVELDIGPHLLALLCADFVLDLQPKLISKIVFNC